MRSILFVAVQRTFLTFCLLFLSLAASASLPDFKSLIKQKSPAVVKINTTSKPSLPNYILPDGRPLPDMLRRFFEPHGSPDDKLHSMGSGFFISADGYLVTNHHVIDGADEIVVRMTDRREFEAKLIGTDERSDLALLKVEAKDLPYLEFASESELEVGDWVVAIGSPFGLDFSASAGIVSAIGRSIPSESGSNYVPFVQTDVAINPGNSGGPLFNLNGDVVGVNSQIYTRSGGSIGLSFAIPSALTTNVVKQLKKKGRVDRGWLGVGIQEVDRDLASSFGLEKPMGALITQLESSGPAAKAGIRVGDIITEFNGVEILSSSELPHAVGVVAPGDKVSVKLVRKGKKKTLQVKIGALDKEASVSYSEESTGDRLGVVVGELSEQEKDKYYLSGGVKVVEVANSSPAHKTGLRKGDIIAQLGFEEVEGVEHFNKLVLSLKGQELYPVRFISRGRAVFATIYLEE